MQSVWKNRDFLWLVSGQTISEFGSAMTAFAVPWLILELTGSAAQMGIAFAVGFTPYLLLSLPAGVWADKFNRKKLMLIADTCRVVLISSIPLAHFLGILTIWQLYVIQAGMSAFGAMFDTAYVACLPSIVNKDQLSRANAVLQTGVSMSTILGPPLAGVMVGVFGAANTIVLNGLSYVISVISLLAIRKSFSAEGRKPLQGTMISQIGEGLRFVWNHSLIRTISLFTMMGNLGGSAVNAILLYHLAHNLHVSSAVAGLVWTGFSAGTIVGSLVSSMFDKRLSMGTVMAIGLAGMSFGALVMGVFPTVWVIAVSMFVQGVSAVIWNIQSITLRQSAIPDELLGRAGSAIRMIAWGSMPVGSASGGAFAQAFGAPVVFLGVGIMQVGVWAWGFKSPLYRVTKPTLPTAAEGVNVPSA